MSDDMWDLMKSGLSGPVKKKIKTEIKKDKIKKESNLPTKKPATGTTRRSIETPLDETEALLKKKVSIGELTEYMDVQEDRKKRREDAKARGETLKPGEQPRSNLLADLFKDSPEKLEAMSPDNLLKLSMLQGGGGGGMNPLLMMMMMNNNRGTQQTAKPQQATSILDLVKAMKELKTLTKEDKPVNQNNDMNQALTLMMMERFMQNKNQEPTGQSQNQMDLVKYLTTLIADQNKVREDILTDKLRQLEYQVAKYDPLEEGSKMIEYMKNFKTLFGGNMTPEVLKHELDIKRLDMEEMREARRNDEDDRKMTQIGSIIEKTVDTLSSTLAAPIAEGLKERMAKIKKKKEREPDIGEEIDIADLDYGSDIKLDEPEKGMTEEYIPEISEIRRRNRSRFRVVDSTTATEE